MYFFHSLNSVASVLRRGRDHRQTQNKDIRAQRAKQVTGVAVLPSFVNVCRRRPLDGRPVLVDLLIQRQRQWSVSHRQPQHQSLLGNRDRVISGPAHVFLGVVKALDRLIGEKEERKNTRISNQTGDFKIVPLINKLLFFQVHVGLTPLDALKQLASRSLHTKRMQEQQRGIT